MCDRFADVGVHLRHPEREKVDAIWEEGGGAVDEFAEFGYGLDEMTAREYSYPFWRGLSGLGLQLDFEHGVRESFDILGRKPGKGVVDADIHSPPVLASSVSPVEVVFADHRELGV